MLRALLNFAETGKLSAGTLHSGGFDSPFEEAVARAIREAGFHCHAQVGVSSFRIDLGVIDPSRPGEYILGVECDGATYHSARSARDRDRLRQEVLEELGWRLHRIWSTDWFRNPNRECGRLLAAINAARDKAQGPTVETIPEGDQRELKEPESEIEAIEDDDLIAISNTVPYKHCVLRVPRGRDLLDLSVPEIARIVLEVVEGEGPVHTEEVARRIREAFSLQRTGGQILAHVRSGLKYLSRNGSLVHDGEFWSAAGRELQAVRNRRNAELPLRRASMIAPNEYQLAISTIIFDVVAISREDLLVETARLFGFGRTGPDLKEAIDRQTKKLVNTGQLHLDGDVLRLGVPSVPQ
jgi:very-short-patch-repair endonuclease